MSEGYYALGVSPESSLAAVFQRYFSLMDELETKIEYEIEGRSPKVINDFAHYQGAMNEILREKELSGETPEGCLPPESLKKFYYYRGKRLFIEGKLYEAGQSFEKASRMASRDGKTLYFLGRCLLASGNLKLAEDAFKLASVKERKNPYLWLYLGDVYSKGGFPKKALPLWELCLDLDKHFFPALERLERQGVNLRRKFIQEGFVELWEKLKGKFSSGKRSDREE